jgi:tetratricopeptide (TPR) repeat protein
MIREHAWLGVGRGAFQTAFPRYSGTLEYDWTGLYSHAENFIVQWLAEWGMPVGICASLAIVGYVLHEWYGARGERLRFLVLSGLAALLLQNLGDLGLEIPAIAIAAVLALVAGERPAAVTPTERRGLPSALAVAAPLLAVWLAALVWSDQPVDDERREMSVAFRDLPVNAAEERLAFRNRLRDAMLRHPGEAFFPLLGSVESYRARDGSALRWIGRALELGPTNGRVHFVLAQFLGAHQATSQAMLHLRLAAEYDRTLSDAAGLRAAQWSRSVDILLESIPTGRGGDRMLVVACGKTRAALKPDCLRRAVLRSPEQANLLGQLADSLLVALRSGQPPCTSASAESCAQEVDHAARAMAKLDPHSWRPGYLMAKVLLVRGDATGAAALLAKICPASVEGQDCARESVSTAIKSGSDEAIRSASDKYAARECGSAASCAEALDWLGTTLEAAGKVALAIKFYSKAAELESSAARWLRVADRSAGAGLVGVARLALERADRSPDVSDNSRAHAQQLRRRLERGMVAGPL